MSERCKPLYIPEKFSTINELSNFLRDWSVPVDDWGKGETKTVGHLFEEIEEGETRFTIENGKLIALVNAVNIDVYYLFPFENFMLYKLKELKQMFKDGGDRVRDFQWSIAEKLKGDEDPVCGAIRALGEELKIIPDQGVAFIEKNENLVDSQDYPGLMIRYFNNFFNIYLTTEQYRPDGYTEEQEDKTTIWGWEEV